MSEPSPTQPKFDELHSAIGRAVADWSHLEHALSMAFASVTGLKLALANPIFFSARSFNGKYMMLTAAIKAANNPSTAMKRFRRDLYKSAAKKADKWNSVRNKLAHDRPIVIAVGENVLVGALVDNLHFRQSEYTDPGAFKAFMERTLTTSAILESADNFRTLAEIIENACNEHAESSLEKLLQQVRGLPPDPYQDSLERHPS
jgi:hypothetical protein